MTKRSLSDEIIDLVRSAIARKYKKRKTNASKYNDIRNYVKKLFLDYDYIPLAPYQDIEGVFPYIANKKNPIEFMKRFIILMLSESYDPHRQLEIPEDVLEFIRLLRWGTHALSTMAVYSGKDIYVLSLVFKESVERQNVEIGKNIILKRPDLRPGEFKRTLYKKASLLVDTLCSLNFAISDINILSLIEADLGIDLGAKKNVNRPKQYRPSIQGILLASVHQIRDLPAKNLDRDFARLVVDIGIGIRQKIVRKYKTESVSHIEAARDAQQYLRSVLEEKVSSKSLREKILLLSGSMILYESIMTPIYMRYYGLKNYDILSSLTKFKF